ncbi:MAG: type II secretion system protein GspL [Gammaproteobacteria bacterium]|nr:type II secretion system protein GspL [Gammaproteobacteria bacterium]MBU2059218.1 type II secretion system protein GspL [Gammaproteobacteria bacterium]MBU2173769.1 type II secretion system protein GspL [Gammaproteobacteria bacterium]MBU2246925.1 type II secretion system protein GspL [Gammaproteobacteria bacterium]MBU2343495.1 type II secretion system protein GspL [Gammaproteobacteria bacterium]
MNEQLIIRLGSQPQQPISWLVWSAINKEIIASGQLASADELAALSERLGRRPVVALVPAADVVLSEVLLPAKPNRQIIQALPYMLEEEHAEDIEQLYLALGLCQQRGKEYWQQVALCKKTQLEQWVGSLVGAGFQPIQLVPDALLLPEHQDGASAIELSGQWLLRQGPWQASSIEPNWWPDFLSLANIELIYSYSPWPAEILQNVQAAEPELPLALLAQQLPEQRFSLLQGQYAPKKAKNKVWSLWQSSIVLGAGCLALYLLVLGAQVWQQGQLLQQQRAELVTLYKSRFPAESTRDISRQLARKLQGAGSGQDASLFSLLNELQQELAATTNMRLDNLRYDQKNSELRFQAEADSFQRFDHLKTRLEQKGFEVKQGALSNEGGKVQGTVAMKVKV